MPEASPLTPRFSFAILPDDPECGTRDTCARAALLLQEAEQEPGQMHSAPAVTSKPMTPA